MNFYINTEWWPPDGCLNLQQKIWMRDHTQQEVPKINLRIETVKLPTVHTYITTCCMFKRPHTCHRHITQLFLNSIILFGCNIINHAKANWKAWQPTGHYGHLFSVPTPKEYTMQQLDLTVTTALAVHPWHTAKPNGILQNISNFECAISLHQKLQIPFHLHRVSTPRLNPCMVPVCLSPLSHPLVVPRCVLIMYVS